MKLVLVVLAWAVASFTPTAAVADCGGSSSGSRDGKSEGDAHGDRAAPRRVSAPAAEAPADASSRVLASYLRVGAELAADRPEPAAREAKLLAAAAEAAAKSSEGEAKAVLGRAAAAASRITGSDIAADRKAFLALSEAMMSHVEQSGTAGLKVHAFHCSMYPGSWMQASATAANPYYGKSMLRCGEPRIVPGSSGPPHPAGAMDEAPGGHEH
jgi:hypothetical protein